MSHPFLRAVFHPPVQPRIPLKRRLKRWAMNNLVLVCFLIWCVGVVIMLALGALS